jgi:hypothetical protein
MAQSFLIDPGTSAEQLAAKRRIAEQLLQSGMDASPVGHPLQAMARALQGGLGGYEFYRAGEEDKQGAAEAQKLLAQAFGGGASAAGAAGEAAAGGAAAGPTPLSPAMGAAAAAGRQIPPNYGDIADKLIGSESDGNPNSRAATSSATGSGQFINSTWLDMVKRHRPDLAQGRTPQQVLALRTDPTISREMTAAYAQDNAGALEGGGQQVNPATLKLAHFLGPAGARAVLSADPNAPVAQLLPKAVASNPFMANMRAGDMLPWAEKQMQRQGGAPAAAQASAQPSAAGGVPDESSARTSVALRLMGNRRTAPIGQMMLQAELAKEKQKPTGDIQEYALAVKQGFPGSFEDWQLKMKQASRTQITNTVGAGETSLSKSVGEEVGKSLTKGRDQAASAVQTLTSIGETRKLLDSKQGVITGSMAGTKLALGRLLEAGGVIKPGSNTADLLANTQAFGSSQAQQVLANIKALGANPSNADRDYIEKAAAGSIEMDEAAIRKVLDIGERASRQAISTHNDRVKKLGPNLAPFGLEVEEPSRDAQAPGGIVKWERGADGQLRRVQQ